jgi:hypothetical protein
MRGKSEGAHRDTNSFGRGGAETLRDVRKLEQSALAEPAMAWERGSSVARRTAEGGCPHKKLGGLI